VGTPTNRTEGKAEGIDHGVGQASISTGGDVKQMETTAEKKLLELVPVPGTSLSTEGALAKKVITRAAIGLEHTPGKKGAHVELGHPGRFKNLGGQGVAELPEGEGLGTINEVSLVLKGRQLLQHRDDPIETVLGVTLVIAQALIGRTIGEGMVGQRGLGAADDLMGGLTTNR
jgi:hypothetical protein